MVLLYVENITNIAESNIKKTELKLGLRNLNRLDSFIHKDVSSKKYCNNVVYKLQCNDCDASYVG